MRPPQPGDYDEPQWSGDEPREPQGRWWMPIVVGIIALVLLGVLGWGIYEIVRNTSTNSPATPATSAATVSTPSAVPSIAPSPTVTSASPSPSATIPSTADTTQPSPTGPTSTVPTTNPTIQQVSVPALTGYPLPEAQAALYRSGLKYRMIYRASSSPAGTVIDSDPKEGDAVPPDTTVTLVVAGPAPSADQTSAGN